MSKAKQGKAKTLAIVESLLKKTVENGCTEFEARDAALKAQEIMLKYNIDLEEIKNSGESEANDPIITERYQFKHIKRQHHHLTMLNLVTENFRTKGYYGGNFVYVFGFEVDVKASLSLYEFLVNYVESSFRNFLEKEKKDHPFDFMGAGPKYSKYLKRQYIHGFLFGLNKAFKDRAAKQAEYSLMVVTPALVVQEYEKLELKTTTIKVRSELRDDNAFNAGVKDGEASVGHRELED